MITVSADVDDVEERLTELEACLDDHDTRIAWLEGAFEQFEKRLETIASWND